jgi:hypothetical protein
MVAGGVTENPTIWPKSLIPTAQVPFVAEGSSRVVYLPPLYRKPWTPVASP